jgi:hypothetical protein
MKLRQLLSTQERPRMQSVEEQLQRYCHERGCRAPARATLYASLLRTPAGEYAISTLPRPVRDALYNLDPGTRVPAHQLAFYCFNYGDLAAISFAAGLPWLALYQAARMRGFRPKSRGLLEAVLRARGI